MKFKTSLIVFLGVVALCSAITIDDSDPYRHTRILDPRGDYVLEWLANHDQSRIYFNVTVRTRGYVGFGLSKKGLNLGADIVIGGVLPDGRAYFSDRHGVADERTRIDETEDWSLDDAWESKTHTFLSFSRPFETCDKTQDLGITNDLTEVIYFWGETDHENYEFRQNYGSKSIYLLDPDLTPEAVRVESYSNITRPRRIDRLGDWKVWRIPVDIQLSSEDTSQICTFHKAPTKSKHHIVGFRAVMGELERKHVHHFILHVCYPPKGVDPDVLFGRYVGHPGELCYVLYGPRPKIPSQYCQEARHVWAIGAEPVFFPDHVGVPLSETTDEYYMLQIHYDNPEERSDIRLNLELEMFYSSKLRKYDAGMMYTGVATPGSPSIIVPPNDPNHIIYGHCAAGCTKKMLPESGINVFAGILHTHLTGKGVRALHIDISDLQEHAVLADDNYNFWYQPVRILREERTIMPGDMIVDRCIYDSTNRTKVTVGAFSTQHEMCNVFMWYYPYIRSDKYAICSGEIRSDAYRNTLQVFQTSWSDEKREEIVTSPPSNAGLTISEATSRLNWNVDLRTQLQSHHRFLPQVTKCPSVGPDAVTRELLGQSGYSDYLFSPQSRYVQAVGRQRDSGTFSEIEKEIQSPGNEFISLWPRGLKFYSPPTICPKD